MKTTDSGRQPITPFSKLMMGVLGYRHLLYATKQTDASDTRVTLTAKERGVGSDPGCQGWTQNLPDR